MKKSYRINFLFRIMISFVVPYLFAGLQVFSHGKSPLFFLWMTFLAAPIYSFFSLHISILDDELCLSLSFPWIIILKRISFEDITAIDAQKNLFFMTFYIRATVGEKVMQPLLSQIFDTSPNLLIILPIINKRRDLLRTILERKPAVKLDVFTSAFLKEK